MTFDNLKEMSPEARAIWLVLFAAAKVDGAYTPVEESRIWEVVEHHGLVELSPEDIGKLADSFKSDQGEASKFLVAGVQGYEP